MSPGVFLLRLLNPVLNTPQNILHVLFDITILKSEDLESETFQVSSAIPITGSRVPPRPACCGS
jgi:hypothetical protein